MLIDTHTHLYTEAFSQDLENVMERAFEAGVQQFYLPAIDSTTHAAMLHMEDKYPGTCLAMMGVHPCSVKDDWEKELAIAQDYLSKKDFVAIGEIGLDFYWDITFKMQQYEAFEQQMQWALAKKLPIVIHTRNAMQETIELVKPFAHKGLRGIFHCFGGSAEEARKIIDLGFLLGVGGIITYKKSGLAEVLRDIPLEFLVLETDAPYLTPVPFRGKRNESAYLEYVAQALAKAKNISYDEVAEITTINAKRVFSKGMENK